MYTGFLAGPSVFSEVCPPPKLRASALIWSLKCGSTTGLLTGGKRKPSGRSWPWTPSPHSPTASTRCCRTVRHIIPRPALHLPVRVQVQFSLTGGRPCVSQWLISLYFKNYFSNSHFLRQSQDQLSRTRHIYFRTDVFFFSLFRAMHLHYPWPARLFSAIWAC